MLKTLKQFIVENYKNSDLPQIQLIMGGTFGLTGKDEPFTKKAMATIYDKYCHLVPIQAKEDNPDLYNRADEIPDDRRISLNYDEPILGFCGNSPTKLLKKEGIKLFNKPKDCEISASKLKFHKEFDGASFIPKTVFNLDDIEKLELPIIAKPSEGFSAAGIEKFDSYEDARKSKLKFDIWCECKEIEREFRAFIMNGKIIHIVERITNRENDMSVGKKKPNEKIDLVYIDQSMDGFPYLDKFNKMFNELCKKVKLDCWCIDIMVDKDKDIWVPEINSAPGISPSAFYPIYKNYLKLAYNKDIDDKSNLELSKMAEQHRKDMKNEYPKEYNYSLHPMLDNKKIKTLEHFIFEKENKQYYKKINFVINALNVDAFFHFNKKNYGEIIDKCLNSLFNVYWTEQEKIDYKNVDNSLPTIYYGAEGKDAINFIKKHNIKEDVMYNVPGVNRIGVKSTFYKTFADEDFICKAVYKREDAKNLKFPVIAKPDNNHSGLGIEKFDSYEELEKSKRKFDNYSEAKDLDREFRVLLCKDEIILVHERVSKNDNEIEGKSATEKTNFTYVDQDLNKIEFTDKIYEISQRILKEANLGLWSIDLLIDKAGDYWVAEINDRSGMACDKMVRIYIALYEDFYGEKLPTSFKEELNKKYLIPTYKKNFEENSETIKLSKDRVNYESIISGKETIL